MDNVERQSPGFSIEPFEPPIVPMAGDYELLYYDEIGQPLPPPREKALLRLEPIARLRHDTTGKLAQQT